MCSVAHYDNHPPCCACWGCSTGLSYCPLASPGWQLHGTPILRRGFLCCTAFGLEYRFATTYSLLCLHVWLALVRLRVEAKDGKDLAQMMYDNFQEDVEIRVRAEGVKVSISLLAIEQLLTERSGVNISMECELT